MVKRLVVVGIALAVVTIGLSTLVAEEPAAAGWSIQASIIEACSCPMFCQCYFNATPSAHGGHGGHDEHFCRFNNAFRVSEGHHGDVDLTDALFWVAGDLGSEFDDGKMDWAVLTFDPRVSPEQRAGIAEILGHVYPVEWESFTVAADAEMAWTASDARAEATLDGGKTAHVILNRMANHAKSPVIEGLNYWGLPANDGFVLMPNEVEAYRLGDKAFEYKGGNGFMLSFDLSSEDLAVPASR